MSTGSNWPRREGNLPELFATFSFFFREALETSLLENEELHTSLTMVEEEKEAVERERDNLKEMAEQAEELAKIVKSLVPDDESEEEADGEGNEDNEEKVGEKKVEEEDN